MANDTTLLQRLRLSDAGRARPVGAYDMSVLADSILANLQNIFNSRTNCCETRPDYGLPDFNDYVTRFPDAIAAIGRAVKDQVSMFEPRLSQVSVKHLPDEESPTTLSFQIDAVLEASGRRHRIGFETIFSDDGFVRIRG